MPWKNGGGSTTEIFLEPATGIAARPFLWRVSIANVTVNGPFSIFAGCDRHIMGVDGDGMVLDGGPDGAITVAPAFVPKRFSGDWRLMSRLLGGPVRDFNLIADRSRVRSGLACEHLIAPRHFEAGNATLLIHALQGAAEFATDRLEQNESLLLAPGEAVTFTPLPGTAPRLALCRVGPRGPSG